MPQIEPQTPQDADNIISIIKAGLPLGFMGLVVGILWHIAEVCHERSWQQRLAVILVSGCFGAVLGPTAFHLMPLVLPHASPSVCMAVSCMIAAMGPQGLAMLLRALKGCSIVSLKSPEDIEQERERLSPKERAAHADNCPFARDRYMGACINCPHSRLGQSCEVKESNR